MSDSRLDRLDVSVPHKQVLTGQVGFHALNTQELRALISWQLFQSRSHLSIVLSSFFRRAPSPDSWEGCPTRMDPSAACTTSRLQNLPFPTSQGPKVKRCFNLEIACSQTSSPPPVMSSTATPTIHTTSTKTHGSKTDVSKPRRLAVARKQFLRSLVPSASPLTVFSSCTQTPRDSPRTPSGGIRTKSGSFRLIGSPVLNACCASQNCSLSVTAHRL